MTARAEARPQPTSPAERRRIERRLNAALAELTLPEVRRMMITSVLFVLVLLLFLWMVRKVIIATILGIIVASYLRPVSLRLERWIRSPRAAAAIALLGLLAPIAALSAYSYAELADVAGYVNDHQADIATRIDTSLHRLPFLQNANTGSAIRRAVL